MILAIIDRIKYDGPRDGSPWLVHKYPSEQFALGSQLVVNSGQEVLFFKGGEALDLFGAGTHTLKLGNLPLLSELVNLPFGGKTPFTAEVYYINKTSRLDMGWGTSTPMDFEDPRYGVPLTIRAHGQYGLTVPDTRLFIIKLIGAVPGGALMDYYYVGRLFNGLINTKLKSLIHGFMVQRRISFLDISGYLDGLSIVAQKVLYNEFERFGVELINFFIEAIKPRDDDPNLVFIKEKRSEIASKKMEFDELGDGFKSRYRFANNTETSQSNFLTISCMDCGMQVPIHMKFCGSCGKKMASKVVCWHCGEVVPVGMKFCGKCGTSVGEMGCASCGMNNIPGMKFCGNCGTRL